MNHIIVNKQISLSKFLVSNKETGDNAISVVTGAAGALTIDDVKKAEYEIKNASFFLTKLCFFTREVVPLFLGGPAGPLGRNWPPSGPSSQTLIPRILRQGGSTA